MLDPSVDQFIKPGSVAGGSSIGAARSSSSVGPLQFVHPIMRYLSSLIHGMDKKIRQLIEGLPLGLLGATSDDQPSLTSIVVV